MLFGWKPLPVWRKCRSTATSDCYGKRFTYCQVDYVGSCECICAYACDRRESIETNIVHQAILHMIFAKLVIDLFPKCMKIHFFCVHLLAFRLLSVGHLSTMECTFAGGIAIMRVLNTHRYLCNIRCKQMFMQLPRCHRNIVKIRNVTGNMRRTGPSSVCIVSCNTYGVCQQYKKRISNTHLFRFGVHNAPKIRRRRSCSRRSRRKKKIGKK